MAKRYVFGLLLLLAALAISGFLVAGKTSEAAAPPVSATGPEASNYPKLQPTESTAVQFDVSPPLRDMVPLPVSQKNAGDLQEGGPNGDTHAVSGATDSPVSSLVQSLVGPLAMPTPLLSFDGPPNLCGCSPPDPNGEVGPNNYVVMTNLDFQIFDKSGTSLFGPAANNTLWSGFGGGCQTHNDGDPVVVYDQFADRWLLSQFTASAPYYNCVALSQTGDPTGAYYRWAFAVGNGNNFGDYPKYGVWSDAYHISTREFAGGSTFVGVGAYALDKAQMLAGNPNPTVISFLAPPSPAYVVGDGILPADIDGSTLPPAGSDEYYMGSEDNNGGYGAPNDALTLWKFHADFGTPANSTFTLANTIATAPFNSVLALCGGGRNCIPQPGTSNKIDHQGYRQRPIFRLAYRNMGSYETLVTNQSVSAGTGPNGEVSGINWWEVRSPASSPVIYQQGTYAPGLTDGVHRWMGSLAMDHDGNMALGFSAGNSTLFPSIYYTGRLVNDPLGQMPQGEAAIVTGTGSQTGSQRWGDYSDMTVDPVDDCTFWFVSEYVPTSSSNGWRTRIGSFKYPGCNGASTPTPTATGTPPTNTPTDTPTDTPSPTATACGITNPIDEGFEGGLNTFSSVVGTCVPGGCGWTPAGNPHSGSGSAFAPDLADVSDQYLQLTNAISIPAGSTSATLSFWHAYDMENTFDGGVLEVSTDGGTTWVDVLAAGGSFISGGYDATISTNFNSPIGGRQAWTGAPAGYHQVQVNLNSLIGQNNLKIRFREANDDSVSHVGWNVDDVLLSVAGTCSTSTNTPIVPTDTPIATDTAVATDTPVSGSPTETPTACTLSFEDVPPGSTFYPYIQCLACRGIINGYPCGGPGEPCNPANDPYFRPSNNVSRGQFAKIAANSAGFNEPPGAQQYEDVPVGSTFFDFIWRLSDRGYVTGYPCGGAGEPCGPNNLPYFRPNANVTRGQLSKIDANAAGFNEPAGAQQYEDVAPGSTFYDFIWRLSDRGIINGYPCGGAGEPCGPNNLPYFRPGANATRGQASKIVANTFFPNCQVLR